MSANRWIVHVKEFASKHNMTYGEALKNTTCKATYRYYNQFLIKGAGGKFSTVQNRDNQQISRLDYVKNIFIQLQKELDEVSPLAAGNDEKFHTTKAGQIWSNVYMSYNVDRIPQQLEEQGDIDRAISWYATMINEILDAWPYFRDYISFDGKDFIRGLGFRKKIKL